MQLPHEERLLLRTCYPNVLLTGSPESTAAAIDSFRPYLRPPIVICEADRRLLLPPAGTVRTLILQDLAWLAPDDQRRLLEWIRSNDGATQIVSTSSLPLLPIVRRGVFLEVLYYHLNVIYLEVAS